MADNNRVAIELYVDDQGSVHVREFKENFNQGLDEVEKKSQTVTEKMRAGWGQVKAAWVEIGVAIMAMREAWGLMNMAAKAEQEKAAFASLAQSYGTNAEVIIAALKQASGETIATMDLIRASGTAMMMGIDPETITKLMEIARATSKMTGQTVSKSFDDIALAVGRQSRMILDNLGIIIDVGKANEAYAASLGKATLELTDAETKQAFLNATLAGGTDLMEKLGNQGNSSADKLQRMSATVADLKVDIGDGLLRAFNGLLATMYTVESGLMSIVQGASKAGQAIGGITDKLHITSGAAARWKINADAARDAGVDFAEKATLAYKDMITSNDDATQSQAKLKKGVDDTSKAIDGQAKAEKSLSDQKQKLIADAKKQSDEQQKITTEMYKEAGLGADQYFRQESSKLIEKAAKWKASGAETLAVEEWLYNNLGKLSEEAWGRGEEAASIYMDSLQAQSRTLVDEFDDLQQKATARIEEIAGKAADLDGTKIGLVATFDGSAVLQGLDQLIAKFNQLKAATVNATPSPQGGGQQPSAPDSTGATASRQPVNNTSQTIINVNQAVGRSDILAIAAEARRQGERS